MRFPLGLVIGKFLPPHRGHQFVIETALRQCDALVVIVCGKPCDPIPAEKRQAWLQELHPAARIMLIDDRYDPNDSRLWAENVVGWLGRSPDAVFTSEDYGDAFSRYLSCAHVMVDRERTKVPCSGTEIRRDPYAYWDYISAPIRGWYAKRVCILGAESTGTTTLSQALADSLDTIWVPEFGREYSALKQAQNDNEWRTEEFALIATEQNRREDMAARFANRLLICDTNSFATRLWHRRYIGGFSHPVDQIASRIRCDFYILTGDEIPFVQDGLRDGEEIRHQMQAWFREELSAQPIPWIEVRGPQSVRLDAARCAIAPLFANSRWSLRHDME